MIAGAAGGVAAIVLAAGVSSRFGGPKQLVPWGGWAAGDPAARLGAEEPLVRYLVRQVLAARVEPVVVVLGYRSEEVARALAPLADQASAGERAGERRLWLVVNPDRGLGGQSSSIRVGLAALPPATGAVVLVLCDQPLVQARHIRALVDAWGRSDAQVTGGAGHAPPPGGRGIILASAAGARRGPPVLFSRAFFPDLASLQGDEGGRGVMRRHPEAVVEVPVAAEVLEDIDTWDDYLRLRAFAARRPPPSW